MSAREVARRVLDRVDKGGAWATLTHAELAREVARRVLDRVDKGASGARAHLDNREALS